MRDWQESEGGGVGRQSMEALSSWKCSSGCTVVGVYYLTIYKSTQHATAMHCSSWLWVSVKRGPLVIASVLAAWGPWTLMWNSILGTQYFPL